MTGPDIHRKVLDDLRDGVLVVRLGARIETLNPAVERLLDLEAGEAQGRTFAELYTGCEGFDGKARAPSASWRSCSPRAGFDDFTRIVIDAHDAAFGRRVVEVQDSEGTRSLSVVTSCLRRVRRDGRVGGGAGAAHAASPCRCSVPLAAPPCRPVPLLRAAPCRCSVPPRAAAPCRPVPLLRAAPCRCSVPPRAAAPCRPVPLLRAAPCRCSVPPVPLLRAAPCRCSVPPVPLLRAAPCRCSVPLRGRQVSGNESEA